MFAPQAEGSGKTFFGENLPAFIAKDLNSSDSVLKKTANNEKCIEHFKALSETRSIVVPFGQLYGDCKSLDEAVTLSIVEQLFGEKERGKMLPMVRESGLSFAGVCQSLVKQHKGLVVVLDDVVDLILSNSAFLNTSENEEQEFVGSEVQNSAEEVMRQLRNLIQPVLSIPGVVVYTTGRAPQAVYSMLSGSITTTETRLTVKPLVFDSFNSVDLLDLLNGRTGTAETVRDELGLRNDDEVGMLVFLMSKTTGGMCSLVATYIQVIKSHLLNRGPEVDVLKVMMVTASQEIGHEVHDRTSNGIYAQWDPRVTGWDRLQTVSALKNVLLDAKDDTLVYADKMVTVADGVHVSAFDLLSVLGIPFAVHDSSRLSVRMGIWMIHALCYPLGMWTHQETVRYLVKVGEFMKK